MFDLIDMFIVRPIVNILFVIYGVVGDFGVAVIIFTVLVKLAMWPLMKSQFHQTRIMREIQPELAEIKKRCNGNQQLESLQMMDLYKRKNVKPFRSMATIFIQLPIFIALFTAINVSVRPCAVDDQYTAAVNSCASSSNKTYTVEHSAYFFIEKIDRINELIQQQNTYLTSVTKASNDENTNVADVEYEFEPRLFGLVNLSATAGFSSKSSVVILIFALCSAAMQYIMSKQQDPSRKKGKKKNTMRNLMREAANGKEASQEDINAVAQGQMTWMMPLMMLFIMINLPGAIVFYYLLNNCITVFLQKVILNRNYNEMENAADKSILRELKKTKKELKEIQEAELVEDNTLKKSSKNETKQTHYKSSENKNNNTHITRISVSDKKKRRK